MFATLIDYVGLPPIANWGGFDLTTPKSPLGTIVAATDPYWGSGEFIYLQAPASQAAKVGTVYSYDVALGPYLAALMANTSILGKAAAVGMNALASSATPQYGWFQISGYGPVWSNANIVANTAIGIVAAGQGGVLAAGKQLNNARVTAPSTTNFTKTVGTNNGSAVLQTPNSDGIIVGMLVAGTGIPATTIVNSIAVDGKSLVMSANATATNSVTGTFTFNDATNFFNLCTYDRIAMQGPIT